MKLGAMYFAASLMLLAACTEPLSAPAPELLEPSAVNDAYRPVERGSIGEPERLMGIVVPLTYSCRVSTTGKVEQLTVGIGDYVEQGQVVAYTDTADARERLEKLEAERAHQIRLYEISCGLNWEQQYLIDIGKNGNPKFQKEMAAARERADYEGLLHTYQMQKLEQEIIALQEQIADAAVYAPHSGMVTWMKNLTQSSGMTAAEKLLEISDMENCCIQAENSYADRYSYGDYEVKYVKLGEMTCPVTELTYTVEERVQARAAGNELPMRFVLKEDDEKEMFRWNLGDSCLLYFQKKVVQDVPIIGRDSMYEENGSYYVYVLQPDGERRRQSVTIGETDNYYAEVTEGLEEGDLVYYQSETRLPVNYSTYRAELSAFERKNHTVFYEPVRAQAESVRSRYSGQIAEVAVQVGETVAEGDLLYTVDMGAGQAALTAARYAIEQEAAAYEARLAELDRQEKELRKQTPLDEYAQSSLRTIAYERQRAEEEHAYTQPTLQQAYEKIALKNDGTGRISVYAGEAGVVERVAITAGSAVTEGQETVSIGSLDVKLLRMAVRKPAQSAESVKDLNFNAENPADLGEVVQFRGEEGYRGICVGRGEQKSFYIRLEDGVRYEELSAGQLVTFSELYLPDVMLVPKRFIHTETTKTNRTYTYAWRIVDEQPVKQYVTVDNNLQDDVNVLILRGVEPGDVLAVE